MSSGCFSTVRIGSTPTPSTDPAGSAAQISAVARSAAARSAASCGGGGASDDAVRPAQG